MKHFFTIKDHETDSIRGMIPCLTVKPCGSQKVISSCFLISNRWKKLCVFYIFSQTNAPLLLQLSSDRPRRLRPTLHYLRDASLRDSGSEPQDAGEHI